MTSHEPGATARRVAEVRALRRLTQSQLATAAAVSLSLIRKIEQGSRRATPDMLGAIAAALDVELGALTVAPEYTESRVHALLPDLRRALESYDMPDDGPVRTLAELRGAVSDTVDWRLASQYTRIAQHLPALLEELCRAVQLHRGADQQEAFRLLALAYRAADGVAYKFGYRDLSSRIIELMRWAASGAADELLDAAVAYVRTEVFFANHNLQHGLRALDSAAGLVRPGTSAQAAAAYGSLHMRAAVVAARCGDAAACDHLGEAHDAARHVNEGVYHGTAFGPSSVRVHEVAVAVERGDGGAAVQQAAGWAPPLQLPAERRSHYYIDLARAQLWVGHRDKALICLQAARDIAPQHVREHPQVRQTLATLLRLGRTCPETLRTFARWVGLVQR